MMETVNNREPTTDDALSFAQRLKGRFSGMVRLADTYQLAADVVERDGWYVVDPTRPYLELPSVDGETAGCHLEGLMEEILREEKGVWSTLIYVQSMADPQIIKIFHPRRAGCGCGGQGGIKPWWVLTRIKPDLVPEWGHDSASSPGAAPTKIAGFSWIKGLF
ncbi:MAG: hypothetical protein HQL67_04290 [Magnetococcales bacterium]|nr:hypothetical protein [Magnetococcales bacterium]